MPGGRIDILVEPDLRGFPGKLASGLRSASNVASTVGRGLGLALAAGTGAAAVGLKSIIQLGNDYTANLNEMQAVSGATAVQMQRVGKTAKDLGSDMTLPATSAADAANAMVELAKGGLSVDEAMQAAKGTLQLAAAAQVDGATAAELQSAALNSFGLAAGEAGRVADVLANTANASASSMIDVGNSLKYVAPVSAALKISIEDTAAAIGLLANQGIKGEQAGTSLRGILASLASPSAAAKSAMDALGLSVFDAQGKFVGLRAFTDQLAQAKLRLTDADFAAAASTAFGNEGFTAANALAAEGAANFDAMAESVARSGGAADVAAAKTKGLGGAWEGFKSQVETASIEIYEVIAPGLERGVLAAADFVARFTPTVVNGIETAVAAGEFFGPGLASAIQSRAQAVVDVASDVIEPLADGIRDTLNSAVNVGITVFGGFVDVVREGAEAVEPLATGIGDLIEGLNAAEGPASALVTGLGLIYDGTAGLISIVAPAVELVGNLVGAFGDLPGPIQTAALAILALRVGPSIFSGLRSALSGAGRDAEDAATKTGLFSRTLSLVTSPVRLAASGITSVAGTVRQLSDEMRVQRAYAAAAGESVGVFTASMGALRTTTIPSIVALREFADQAGDIRRGAAAVEQPISAVGAALATIAERSPALTQMRDTYRSTFDTLAAASERAGLRVGVLAESMIDSVTQIGRLPSRIGAYGTALRATFDLAADNVTARANAMVRSIQAFPTAVGVAAISLQERLAGAARSAGSALASIPTGVGVAAISLQERLGGAINRVGEAFAALPSRIALLPTAIGVGVVGALDRIPGAAASAVNAVGRLGAVAVGTATSLGRGLTSAVTGLVGAMGGPAGLAIAGLSLGLSFLASKQAEAKAKADQHKQAVQALTDAFREAEESGRDTAAVFRDSVVEQLTGEFSDATDAAATFGIGMRDLVDTIVQGGPELDNLKLVLQALYEAEPLSVQGKQAERLLDVINQLRGQYDGAVTATERLEAAAEGSLVGATDQGRSLAAAMGVLADETSSADDKARALKQALDALAGGTISLEQSQSRVNELLGSMRDRFSDVENHADGFGKALLNADGSINTATENGRYLLDTMDDLGTAMTDVAQKTYDTAIAAGDNIPTAMGKAKAAADGVRQSFIDQGAALGLLPEQVQALADRYGIVPEDVATLITSPGMDSTKLELILLKSLVDQVPEKKPIVVESLSDAAKQKLVDFGFTVRTLPNGKIEVTANTASAKAELDNATKPRTVTITAIYRGASNTAYGTMNPLGSYGGALGGIMAPAYATGGIHTKLTPMKAGVATVVPPNTWRIVGDRLRDDEFYIPDNNDPRSVSLGLEWARRRGFVLARTFAAGGVATTSPTPGPVTSPVTVNMPVSVQDNRSASEFARVASSEVAWAARFSR